MWELQKNYLSAPSVGVGIEEKSVDDQVANLPKKSRPQNPSPIYSKEGLRSLFFQPL